MAGPQGVGTVATATRVHINTQNGKEVSCLVRVFMCVNVKASTLCTQRITAENKHTHITHNALCVYPGYEAPRKVHVSVNI